MSNPTPEQQKALKDFNDISDILYVPVVGQPMLSHRKWIVPCPDRWALADFPDAKERLESWKREWTSCGRTPVIRTQADQSSDEPEKKEEQ